MTFHIFNSPNFIFVSGRRWRSNYAFVFQIMSIQLFLSKLSFIYWIVTFVISYYHINYFWVSSPVKWELGLYNVKDGSDQKCFCHGLNASVPPKFLCWKPVSQGDSISRWGVWEVIRSCGWSPQEWDWCPYKRGPSECPSPSHQVRIQWKVCDLEEGPRSTMLALSSQASRL